MKIQKVIDMKETGEVFEISHRATLAALVQQLCSRGVGALLVTDDAGALAGIVSERDVIRALGRGVDLGSETVAAIMTRQLVSVRPDEDIHAAMDVMVLKKIRHLPVVSDAGACGLVTVRDLIRAIRDADRDEVTKFVEYLKGEIAAK
jgi:CBS domain-containing protein